MDTDSYKLSHWNQYPPGLRGMMSYFESRGGEFPTCTLFGLQYLLHKTLSRRLTAAMVEEASAFAGAHGEPFNRAGWMRCRRAAWWTIAGAHPRDPGGAERPGGECDPDY